MQPTQFFSLEQIIERQPLTVTPHTPLAEVIRLMQEWGNSCSLSNNPRQSNTGIEVNNSCVLIAENNRLVGIFTERDLVKLIATNKKLDDLDDLTVAEVMSRNVVTLSVSDREDLFTALAMLRQHRIRHLPVVDGSKNLLGLITAKNLRQQLQPINLMQWRKVCEVMKTEVIYAAPDDSVRHVAQLMAKSEISCVAIAESRSDRLTDSPLIYPIGIITERDIVQFQNLNLDFDRPASNLMSTPLFLVDPEDTLWSVHQQMQQRRVRRLLVGRRGVLQGIITQTSLLEIFDPSEMYGVIEVLQRQVCQLELERTAALENRQAELERQVTKRTAALKTTNQRLQLEANLRQQSERRFDSILNSLEDVVYSVAPDTFKVVYINFAAEKIYGRRTDEFYDAPNLWLDVVHPEDRDRVAEFAQNVLVTGSQEIEYRIVHVNGEVRWLYDRARLIRNERGTPIRLDGIATDISDRQRRETILKDIASGMSIDVGENFLPSLVEYLSKTLEVDCAYVGKLVRPTADSIKTQAVHSKGEIVGNFEYGLAGTPCLNVVEQQLCVYPQAVQQLFPDSILLAEMEAESFAGMPIYSSNSDVIGLICVVDSKPFEDVPLIEEVLKIFATRATAELERQQVAATLRKSEQKFRAIFDRSFQFIGLLEPNGNLIEANKTALDFIGLTPDDVRGKPFWETPWWSGSSEAQRLIQQGIERAAKGNFVRFEVEHPGTDNRVVTVDFSLTPIEDETGQVTLLIPEGRNISDRKQAEANLQKSNQILQTISSIQTQFLTDVEPGIIFDGMLEHLLELTESEYGFIGEIHIADDGSPIMEESYMKFRGRPYLKTHAITNIAWNEETRAFYAENAPKGMEFHNLQTLFGAVIVTGEPVIANSPSDDPRRGGLPDGHPPLNAFLGIPFYKNDKMTGMAGIANRPGGYDEDTIEYLRPLLDTCSRIIEAYKSERQRQQAEVKNREQAALLDVATDAIMVRGLNNCILYWNRGAENIYGWSREEAIARNANELLYPELTGLEDILRSLHDQGQWQGELKQVTKTGHNITVESRWTLVKDRAGNPQSILVVNTDVTEQKQLEAQFLRTQRLESLGTLAGGIAHDLNNILAPILGFSKLLPLKLSNVDDQTKGFFKIMETNAERGTALVKQILTFSRGLDGDKGIVQVRHLINEIGQIIKETFPKAIELSINAPKNLWTVNADINQLHQVLMNLCVNARDAMPDGGKLIVSAENTVVDREYVRLHLDAAEGNYLCITVTDTGAGIPPEIIDRIFEPFFTTKEIGRGTGLGLSTVIGIIKSHGGFVDVVSKTTGQKGTRVNVFIPASDTIISTAEAEKSIPRGNGELILVVDDETAMLQVTQATLETYNYRILSASNGIEAVATFAKQREEIALVIMDIMMPGMDGKTAIRTLRQIDSNAKIIAVSGLITSQEIISELNGEVLAFLSKPYSNEELLETVDEVIGD